MKITLKTIVIATTVPSIVAIGINTGVWLFTTSQPLTDDLGLLPGEEICSVSSRQEFIIVSQHCPPRTIDKIRVIWINRPPLCRVYGDVYPIYWLNGHVINTGNGIVDYEDILGQVNALGGIISNPETDPVADVFPCIKENPEIVIIDVDDLLAVMDAFQGINRCP